MSAMPRRTCVIVGAFACLSACGSSGSNAKAPDGGGGGGGEASAVAGNGGAVSGVAGAAAGVPGGGSVAGAGAVAGAPAVVSGVTVTPADARVSFGSSVQFKALVTGGKDQAVTWTVQEGAPGGTVTADGLYTAPATSGSFHVVATSPTDAKLFGTARVTVAAASGTPPVLAPGRWTDLTPAEAGLVCCAPVGGNSFGVQFIEIDPGDSNTLYTGIDTLGVWKSTDRGSTWKMLPNPAKAGASGDSPIRLRVDPKDSKHLYLTIGVRGGAMGFWVSKDAGATWAIPPAFTALAESTTTTDVTTMAVDPADFNHVLVVSHSPWKGKGNAGIMESKDGGGTWLTHPPGAWNAGTVGIAILSNPALGLGDSKTWLVGGEGGLWRSTDSGENWTKVSDNGIPHGGSEIYYTATGMLYSGGTPYPARSKDNGLTWQPLSTLRFSYYYTVFGDGKTLYTSPAYTGTNGGDPDTWYTSPEADGLTWTAYQNSEQKFVDGPYQMTFDSANRIVYAANWGAGLLAMKLP